MNDFLKVIAEFSDPLQRVKAAFDLAKLIEAEEIICFVFDETVHRFLPAPGFPQTNRNAKQWHEFLRPVKSSSTFRGTIMLDSEKKEVLAISSNNNCIMVMVGNHQEFKYVNELEDSFTLVASLLKMEFAYDEISGKIKNLEQSSVKSDQLARHLDKAREKLQDALKTEEEFLSIASHELKTPITSINAFIEILLQSFPETKDKQTNYFLVRTKFQVQRLITLISELLDVTKIKAGKLDLHFSQVRVNYLIDELIEDYSSTYSSHKIIKNEIAPVFVKCDKNRIEQVLSNILSNAIKYSPGADKIFLTLSQNETFIQFEIQDFGIGIAEKNMTKVFDRFFREHSGDSGMLSSLGLGLYICADIIKRHNGKIWVESTVGKGTSFYFTLPIMNRGI